MAWELPHHSRKDSADDAIDEASGAWGGARHDADAGEAGGNRARLAFPKVRWSRYGARQAYILSFDPDTEGFNVVHQEDGEERDYAGEIEEFLVAEAAEDHDRDRRGHRRWPGQG